MSNDPRLEELFRRWQDAHDAGRSPALEELCADCPELREELQRRLRQVDELQQFLVSDAQTTTPDAPVREGQPAPLIIGRYQPERLLGRGGFGEVWRAFDPNLQRAVAVKVLRPDRVWPAEYVAHFVEEGRKLARLKHPGIVAVYDVGQEGGGLYIVSELIEGENLADRMQRGRLAHRDAALLLAEVADAVHHAHLRGIVHRDIKPGNILLDAEGRPHLADFGLAVTEEEQPSARGSVAGTTAYMSPEQVRGEGHMLDGRTDIYSLGIVLYELLTGRRPFQGRDRDEYEEQILRREPRPPRAVDDSIPKGLEDVCLKCLAKAVADRYTTAADLANDLRREAGKLAPPAAEVPAVAKTRRPPRAPLAAVALLGIGLVASCLGLVAVGVVWHFCCPSPGPSDRAAEDSPRRADATAPTAGTGRPDPGAADVLRVKKLVWPDRKVSDLSSVKLIEPSGALQVYTDVISLLQLETAPADDREVSVEFRQLNQTGRIGVFFGYREAGPTGTASYELIQVAVQGQGDQRLVRSVQTFPLNAPLDGHSGETVKWASVDYAAVRKHTLQLRIRGGRLERVVFDDRAVPELTEKAPAGRDCRGGFGLYNLRSDGVFSKVVIDGVPKQLEVPRSE